MNDLATPAQSEDFALEPAMEPGHVPERVIEELMRCRQEALSYAEGYSEAVKTQAEKFKVKAGALKRYVNARVSDTLEELNAETDDLNKLLEA